ncbi:F-box protein PP2-B15-like [Argentina anserina]|uniref:F-box protein PP2-B15-like n=1 Tax=Argentina anserina TaxID=57926 RepID=UPI0021764521|nr:F-box protein PP2-B15-like [Potentilla anserina]
MYTMSLEDLPQDCLKQILSLTSPGDACRSSLVSLSIRAMTDSDTVWKKFLPSECSDILSRLVTPIPYSSNKDLFIRLCNPTLIDGGTKMFSIERSTGKKCYMLSARDLSITWASNPLYWSWNCSSESRFAEVAELRTIWWLEICGTLSTEMLSPNTVYGAYLITKLANRAYGLDLLPSEVSLEVGNFKSQSTVYLTTNQKVTEVDEHVRPISRVVEERLRERTDGWMEIELGSFYNDGSYYNKDVKMNLKEVKGAHLKGGLIIEGIEIRPKH